MKHEEEDYFSRHPKEQNQPDEIEPNDEEKFAQLYAKPPDDWLSDDEIEQEKLKQIVQADALKAYGFFRRQVAKLSRWWGHLKQTKTKVAKRKSAIQGIAILLVGAIVVVVSVGAVIRLTKDKSGVLSDTTNQTPDFTTLAPVGQTTQGDVHFDSQLRTATYQDELAGGMITVSQQLMPDEVSRLEDGVAKLALSLESKNTIDEALTNKGLIYIARSETGKQTIIFGFEKILVFITANHEVSNQSWVDYVNNLK